MFWFSSSRTTREKANSLDNTIHPQHIRQNTCAEDAVCTAYAREFPGSNIYFRQELNQSNEQIDITPVFVVYDEADSHLWTNIYNEPNLIKNFNSLDKHKTYFMRTGQCGRAGHYQIIYFEAEQGWRTFSTETNHGYFTNAQGQLTTQGQGLLLFTADKCGTAFGQYLIQLQEVTEKRVIAAANFISDYRTKGEKVAMQNLYTEAESTNKNPIFREDYCQRQTKIRTRSFY